MPNPTISRRFLLLAALGTALTWGGAAGAARAAKVCHLVVIADTNDPSIGSSVAADSMNISSLFSQNVAEAQLDLISLTGDDVSSDNILRTIQGVALNPEDTLIVYYAGHGGYDPQRRQFIQPPGGALYRQQIRQVMDASGARLRVLLTDTCSNLPPGQPQFPVAAALPDAQTSAAFVELCWKPSGFVDISSTQPGEIAMGDEQGGYFTLNFCNYLRERKDDGTLNWNRLVDELRPIVSEYFSRKHPRPRGLFVEQLGITQYVQTIFASLRLSSSPTAPGGGIVVQQIYQGTSASQLNLNGQIVRLDVGDTILSVNGQAVNSSRDFSAIIDSLPQGSQIALRVRDGKSGQVVDLTGQLDLGGGYRFGATYGSR